MVLCFPPRFSPFGEVTRGERLPPPLAPLLDESSPCSWKLIFPQLSSFGLQFSDTFLCTHTHTSRGGGGLSAAIVIYLPCHISLSPCFDFSEQGSSLLLCSASLSLTLWAFANFITLFHVVCVLVLVVVAVVLAKDLG